MEKFCNFCNKIFYDDSYHHRKKSCSEECRKKIQFIKNREFQERRRVSKGISLESNCAVCNSLFRKEETRGKHRKNTCSEACKKKLAVENAKKTLEKLKKLKNVCQVNGCRKTAVRVSKTLCEAHYVMQRRKGSFDKKVYIKSIDKTGYVRILGNVAKNHPLSKNGHLREHRMVAYDVRNGVCENCFWCDAHLSWETCVIDHLNENKSDNRPENLVITCSDCNRARGAVLPFLKRMVKNSYDVFLRVANEYREKNTSL